MLRHFFCADNIQCGGGMLTDQNVISSEDLKSSL